MNIRTVALLTAFAACLASAPLASANQIQFTADGVINSSNMFAFQVGQSISVTFVYDSSGSPQLISNQQAFFIDHFSSLSVVSGSYNSSYSTGTFGQIDMQDNLANLLDGIGFQFSANQGTYQFTNPKPHTVSLASVNSNSINQTFSDLQLSLQGIPDTIWSGYALPTSYNLAQFNANQVMQMTFSNGEFQAGFSHLTIQDVTAGAAAPEPGTLLLLLPAIALFAMIRGKRTQRSSGC